MRKFAAYIFLMTLLLSSPNSLLANSQSSAQNKAQAWHEYSYELTRKAKEGDIASQAIVGGFLLYGVAGFEKDTLLAIQYLENAAKSKNPGAMYTLFEAYKLGVGVLPNKEKALMWLEKSAQHGDKHAQFLLAMKYLNGFDYEKNEEICVSWLTKAAKQGHAEAQFVLGVQYYAGRGGLPVDDIEAYAWLDTAAKNPSLENLKDSAIDFRDNNILKNLSSEQLSEAHKKAEKYYKLYVKPFP